MSSFEMFLFLAWVKICAVHHKADYTFCLAVARVESGTKKKKFRFDMVGDFYLPFGIHKDYAKKWSGLELWPVQTWHAVKRLAQFKGNEKAGLRKWNTAFNDDYWRAVRQCWNKYRRKYE